MSGKYMKIQRVVLPTLTMILLSSMLFGCSATSKEESYNMLNETDQIEIEYAVPEYDASQESEVSLLPWLPLSSLESHPELRKAFESEFNITGTTGNKEGMIYYNPDTNERDQNVTLYMILRNADAKNAFLVKGPMERFGEIASEHYADVEADDLTAPYATINAYFELLPDQEEGQFDGDATISRAQAMTLVMRATTPVNEEQAPETNADFTAKVGNSKYTDFAAPMNDYAYINIENGLNEGVFNTAMSRGEYIYMITNLIYSDYKETLEAKGCKDIWAPTSDITLSTVSNAGDIKFSEAISNASGVPSDMYDTLKLAVQYQLITESVLEDWDSSITKADALEILISMVSNYSNGCGSTFLGSVENAKRTEGIAEIQKTLKEKGYSLTAEDIEYLQRGGWDPLDVGVVEMYETDKYMEENGLTLAEFRAAQGADLNFGWTFIYNHGGAAGNQDTYGIYLKPGSPLYGTRYELGDYLPSGDQICGATGEEYCKMLDKELVEAYVEADGYDYFVDPETGEELLGTSEDIAAYKAKHGYN